MNVGHPSNMARIIALYGGQMDEKGNILKSPNVENLKADMFAISITDKETRETLKKVYDRHKVLLEPHGSVAWSGLQHYFSQNTGDKNDYQLAVALETAHPAKFPQEINQILGIDPELPQSLLNLDSKEEKMVPLENNYEAFKEFLKTNF